MFLTGLAAENAEGKKMPEFVGFRSFSCGLFARNAALSFLERRLIVRSELMLISGGFEIG